MVQLLHDTGLLDLQSETARGGLALSRTCEHGGCRGAASGCDETVA